MQSPGLVGHATHKTRLPTASRVVYPFVTHFNMHVRYVRNMAIA